MKLDIVTPSATAIGAVAALFILASTGTGEAAKKKAAAAPEPKTSVCFLVYHPVCGLKGTSWQTYSNSCYARLDGVKNIKPGACPAKKATKKAAKKSKKR